MQRVCRRLYRSISIFHLFLHLFTASLYGFFISFVMWLLQTLSTHGPQFFFTDFRRLKMHTVLPSVSFFLSYVVFMTSLMRIVDGLGPKFPSFVIFVSQFGHHSLDALSVTIVEGMIGGQLGRRLWKCRMILSEHKKDFKARRCISYDKLDYNPNFASSLFNSHIRAMKIIVGLSRR